MNETFYYSKDQKCATVSKMDAENSALLLALNESVIKSDWIFWVNWLYFGRLTGINYDSYFFLCWHITN